VLGLKILEEQNTASVVTALLSMTMMAVPVEVLDEVGPGERNFSLLAVVV
jgi:hypothetical protein